MISVKKQNADCRCRDKRREDGVTKGQCTMPYEQNAAAELKIDNNFPGPSKCYWLVEVLEVTEFLTDVTRLNFFEVARAAFFSKYWPEASATK